MKLIGDKLSRYDSIPCSNRRRLHSLLPLPIIIIGYRWNIFDANTANAVIRSARTRCRY